MNLIYEFWELFSLGKVSEVNRIILSVLTLVLVLITLIIIIRVISYLLSRSNYTLRRMVSSKYGTFDGRIKEFGKIKYIKKYESFPVVKKIYKYNRTQLEKAGLYSQKALKNIIIFKYFITPVFAFYIVINNFKAQSNNSIFSGVLTLFVLNIGVNLFIQHQIKQEANKFKLVSYILFKFLRNQLSAGVKISHALNNLPSIVSDKLLKERLTLVASHYASTNDVDSALSYINNNYKTPEARTLTLAIKNAIETGSKGKGFEKKENKLFNLRLEVIKVNTQKLKMRYFFIALMYAVVIIVIISYPYVIDLMKSEQIIFGN